MQKRSKTNGADLRFSCGADLRSFEIFGDFFWVEQIDFSNFLKH